MSRTILFLCSGNYYRSRFAQIYFNYLAAREGLDWRASSRGLATGWEGNVGPISPHTLAKLADLRIACDGDVRRLPEQLAECDLTNAHLVIAVKEDEHRPMLAEKFPGWQDRVCYWHVHDLNVAPPPAALAEIETLVRELVDQLKRDR